MSVNKVTLYVKQMPEKLYKDKDTIIKQQRKAVQVKTTPIRVPEEGRSYVKELPLLRQGAAKRNKMNNDLSNSMRDAFIQAVENGKHKDRIVRIVARSLGLNKEKKNEDS